MVSKTGVYSIRNQILNVVTYHSEDGEGTSGYLLSEGQILSLEEIISHENSRRNRMLRGAMGYYDAANVGQPDSQKPPWYQDAQLVLLEE